MAFDKLQKLLAQAGLGSRRAMEVKIQEGVVKVNGQRSIHEAHTTDVLHSPRAPSEFTKFTPKPCQVFF